jgi:hypothetical protein
MLTVVIVTVPSYAVVGHGDTETRGGERAACGRERPSTSLRPLATPAAGIGVTLRVVFASFVASW